MTQARQVAAKSRQREGAKRATAELFKAKKPYEEEVPLKIGGEKVAVLMRAIGRHEYDKLVTECPASTKQRAAGLSFDVDKFAPILLSRVMVDPEITETEWRNIWNDENWNRAELGDIYYKAVDVCSQGVTDAVDPTESG